MMPFSRGQTPHIPLLPLKHLHQHWMRSEVAGIKSTFRSLFFLSSSAHLLCDLPKQVGPEAMVLPSSKSDWLTSYDFAC